MDDPDCIDEGGEEPVVNETEGESEIDIDSLSGDHTSEDDTFDHKSCESNEWVEKKEDAFPLASELPNEHSS